MPQSNSGNIVLAAELFNHKIGKEIVDLRNN